MTINTQIETIRTQLTKLFRDNGVASINYGDIYPAAPIYPAIDILLTDREQNDLQVMQNGKVGWNLSYDIGCMFAGSEGNQTFVNSSKFVDKIYDLLQGKKDDALNNTVFDLECVRVEYGKTIIRSDEMANGGVIRLVIQIFEVR